MIDGRTSQRFDVVYGMPPGALDPFPALGWYLLACCGPSLRCELEAEAEMSTMNKCFNKNWLKRFRLLQDFFGNWIVRQALVAKHNVSEQLKRWGFRLGEISRRPHIA